MAEARQRNLFIVALRDTGPTSPDLMVLPFDCEPAQLYAELLEGARTQPRKTLQSEAPEELQMRFAQHTVFYRFPDYIEVKIVASENGRTPLTVSHKGRYMLENLSVNKR